MLQRLYIKNVALIAEADIVFDKGLNVLSGETGSGKSVILDSINFVLGDKADRTMIRHGENEAIVKAEFSIESNFEVKNFLNEYDIEADDTIIISRKLTIDGRSTIKVNGNAVTAFMLRNITSQLVDVHGQSEHYFLSNEDNQLKVIDNLLKNGGDDIKKQLSDLITQKMEYTKKISQLGGSDTDRERLLDLLDFQIKEISSADLKIGEYEELIAKRLLMQNVEKILLSINSVRDLINSDGGCADSLNSAVRELNKICNLDENYEKVCVRLENASSEIADISETLLDFCDNLNFDEGESTYIEERLSLIKNLKRKYGSDEKEILEFKENAQKQYDEILNSAALIDKYNKDIATCNQKIYEKCLKLTSIRKDCASKFCQNVENELKTLNIPNAKFNVFFKEYDINTANLQSVDGSDEICFEFSANKGEPLKPLNRVISGGEMSRFMLAIKTQLKDKNGITTYIFDEIDTGISGFTAVTVAGKFREISKSTQIIAVSHLPQVCAASDNQLLIYKLEDSSKTLTKVKKLTENEKIEELMRLTGSVNSETARKHAQELIKQIKK